jgi:hypothetical protein
MAISFIGWGNRSTRRKPSNCCKSLTNFITYVVLSTPSCGTIALSGPFYFYFILRTIVLRFSLYQKLSKLRKKNLPLLFWQFLLFFVRYLSTFFYTYLPINIHFQFIIITNISFVTNPAYFVHHLASPVKKVAQDFVCAVFENRSPMVRKKIKK